jgi:hypothetical protein
LWSLDDLFEGGFGFAVEVFLLSLKHVLLSTYSSQESHLCYTSTLSRPLHLTGEVMGGGPLMRHKISFSMQLHLTKASFVRLITQTISRTRSGSCWAICSKDGQATILILRYKSLRISNVRLVVYMGPRQRRSSPGYIHRIHRDRALPLPLPRTRNSSVFMPLRLCIKHF